MEDQPQKSPARYSAEEKQQIIGQWKRSGLSRQAFCRQEQLSYYTLLNWTKKKHTGSKTVTSEFIPLSINPGTEQFGFAHCKQIFAQIETPGKRIQLYQPVTAYFLKQLLR